MKRITRRRALVGASAVGAAVTAGTGLMPRRAKAAGELTVWWTQGFYKAENDAVAVRIGHDERILRKERCGDGRRIEPLCLGAMPDFLEAVAVAAGESAVGERPRLARADDEAPPRTAAEP